MEEIQRIADRMTVLRDGQVVATRPLGEVSMEQIVRWMVGRELGEAIRRTARSLGEVALKVRGLR